MTHLYLSWILLDEKYFAFHRFVSVFTNVSALANLITDLKIYASPNLLDTESALSQMIRNLEILLHTYKSDYTS